MKLTASVIVCLFLTASSEGANILIVTPIPSYSHQNVFVNLIGELLARGHNLTVLTGLPYKNYAHIPNFNEINMVQILNIFSKYLNVLFR